jgi:hypothetical protein
MGLVPAGAYHRLRTVKTRVDPTNLIAANHAIAPMSDAADRTAEMGVATV